MSKKSFCRKVPFTLGPSNSVLWWCVDGEQLALTPQSLELALKCPSQHPIGKSTSMWTNWIHHRLAKSSPPPPNHGVVHQLPVLLGYTHLLFPHNPSTLPDPPSLPIILVHLPFLQSCFQLVTHNTKLAVRCSFNSIKTNIVLFTCAVRCDSVIFCNFIIQVSIRH